MNKSDHTQTEFQLIEDIINGDNKSYRVIVDRYSPMVFHVARGFEKDEEEVEELAQQIFVKAFEKLESFKKGSKFSSWLYSLAVNHCRDYIKNIRRNNRRFSELNNTFLENNMSDTNATPYKELEDKQWMHLLKLALGNLNGDYSEPFLLKYRDGLSYHAMSERMGVSVNALKVRVHRARKELKTLIEKEM